MNELSTEPAEAAAAIAAPDEPRPAPGTHAVRTLWLLRWGVAAGAAAVASGLAGGWYGWKAGDTFAAAAAGGTVLMALLAMWLGVAVSGSLRWRQRMGVARAAYFVLAVGALAGWARWGWPVAPPAGVLALVSWIGVAVWLVPTVHWLSAGLVLLGLAAAVGGWRMGVAPGDPGLPPFAAAFGVGLLVLLVGSWVSRRTALLVVDQATTRRLASGLRRDLEASEHRAAFEAEQRRETEKELSLARDAAEEAMRAKTEFLATMSHEIRTPLNGIVPILDLLQETTLNSEQREYLDTAYKSSRHLMRLINDILDYAKVESGKLELENIEVDVEELVASVADLMGRAAESKGLHLDVEVHEGVPTAVRGDPIRLRQVLTNLVSNAVKFTNHGGIRIEVKRQRVDRKTVELLFAVSDTGIGMSQEAARRLFQSFTQADASTTRKHGGTGLGLVICKRLVELMGGRIGVRTSVNKGSTFWFLLPMRRSLHDVPSVRRDLHGVRALTLVKDPVERERVGRMLQALGILEDRAESTIAALGKLKNSAVLGESWMFDLVLMDTRGHESGVSALVREVQAERALGAIPIVLITPQGSHLEALRRYQHVTIVTAPVQREPLKHELHRLLDVGDSAWRGASGVDAAEKAAWEPSLMASEVAFGATLPEAKVLLVEDNPINLAVARRLLERLGMRVTVAEDGHECLLRIEREGPFDLVLMDVQMPVMDGYEATGKIREMQATGRLEPVPVIAMTANAMQGDRERCLQAGMDDYLPKPIDLSTLRVTLGRWLGAQKSSPQREADQAAVPPDRTDGDAEAATDVQPRSDEEAVPVLDQVVLDDLRDIMDDEFARLVVQYLASAPGQIDELEAAARGGDIDAMVRPAHSLKSSSANMGVMRVSRFAREVEHDAREARGTAAAAALPALREAYEAAARELEAYVARHG